MKRMRIMGLALLAVCAMAVATASVASAAQPVFYTKANVGATAASVPFTGTLLAAFLEPANLSKITCTGGTAAGTVTGATTTKGNTTTFTGCEASKLKCNSTGEGEGVIKTNVLEGTLGNLTSILPGLRLYNEGTKKGGIVAEFTCGGGAVSVVVKGSVMGSFTGASGTEAANGKFAASNKLVFAEAKGVQKYSKFVVGEGEAGTEQLESSTNGAKFEKSGQSASATLKSTPASNLGITK
jgi:hypothetical protein